MRVRFPEIWPGLIIGTPVQIHVTDSYDCPDGAATLRAAQLLPSEFVPVSRQDLWLRSCLNSDLGSVPIAEWWRLGFGSPEQWGMELGTRIAASLLLDRTNTNSNSISFFLRNDFERQKIGLDQLLLNEMGGGARQLLPLIDVMAYLSPVSCC